MIGIDHIPDLFQGPLPGKKAHDAMMGRIRPSVEEIIQGDHDPRVSSVAFLIYPKKSGLHFLLLKRHDYAGVHSGQVGLPGGRLDDGETNEEAMLRELEEETGLRIDTSSIIRELTPLYIPPSDFIVHPFATLIDHEPEWRYDTREVKRGIETPLSELMRKDIIVERKIQVRDSPFPWKVQCFPFDGEVVWGATAMILAECKQILGKFEQ
ncbi:MAG: CoA pyrophosphatase [Flavobacteriales bacterium]|nr:CoA pyrophosphatase [Flavobacteriales bacterium]